jgi:hypothetical protein
MANASGARPETKFELDCPVCGAKSSTRSSASGLCASGRRWNVCSQPSRPAGHTRKSSSYRVIGRLPPCETLPRWAGSMYPVGSPDDASAHGGNGRSAAYTHFVSPAPDQSDPNPGPAYLSGASHGAGSSFGRLTTPANLSGTSHGHGASFGHLTVGTASAAVASAAGTVVQADAALQHRIGREGCVLGYFGAGAAVGQAVGGPEGSLVGGAIAAGFAYYRSRPHRD